MRRQTRAWYKGLDYQNSTAVIVAEFSKRTHLRKLGYVFDGDNLDQFGAECFITISAEIGRIQTEDMEKAKKDGKNNRRAGNTRPRQGRR